MIRILTILICALCFCTFSWAQNLDEMSEAKRNATLIQIATEVVLEINPTFFRECGEPEILHGRVGVGVKPNWEWLPSRSKGGEMLRQPFTERQFERYHNRSFYVVTFFYDKTEEHFPDGFSSQVMIWGDTGKAFSLRFGTGSGFGLLDLDEPGVRERFSWRNRDSSSRTRTGWQRLPPDYQERRRREAIAATRSVQEAPPLTDAQLRSFWQRNLLSESEVEEARRRGILSDSDVEEFRRRRSPKRLCENE